LMLGLASSISRIPFQMTLPTTTLTPHVRSRPFLSPLIALIVVLVPTLLDEFVEYIREHGRDE